MGGGQGVNWATSNLQPPTASNPQTSRTMPDIMLALGSFSCGQAAYDRLGALPLISYVAWAQECLIAAGGASARMLVAHLSAALAYRVFGR